MTAYPIIILSLMLTPPLCMVSNSWLTLWVLLEINTMAFCSISKMSRFSLSGNFSEISMKYFIIQSMASAVFVGALTLPATNPMKLVAFVGGTLAILMKLASAPFQGWFFFLMKKASWSSAGLLMTWQKVAPLYLLSFCYKSVIMYSIVLTALIGSVVQMNKKPTMEVLSLSSIFNLGWMMVAVVLSIKTMMIFLALYWASLLTLLKAIGVSDLKNLLSSFLSSLTPIEILVVLASLAGLPPTLGFLAKWMVIQNLLIQSHLTLAMTMLLLSVINFYIYLRFFNSLMVMKSPAKQNAKDWKLLVNNTIFLYLTLISVVLLIFLDYAWTKSIILME